MTRLACRTTAALAALLVAGAGVAQAQTVDIGFPTTGTWGGPFNGAPTSGNEGSGLTFGNWNSNYLEWTSPTYTLTFDPVALLNDPVVNTLLGAYDMSDGDVIAVTFTNSLGAADTIDLVGGQTIRDYYGGPLSGTGTNVTAQSWDGEFMYNLDAQTFALPTSWAGTNLVSVSFDSTGIDTYLSGLQVGNADVPEPMSLALMAIGMVGLAGVRRFV